MTKQELVLSLKKNMIADLHLTNISIEDIHDDLLLFGEEGLQLDSLDAVELVVLIEKYYGVSLTNIDEAKQVFVSVSTLADYILKHKV